MIWTKKWIIQFKNGLFGPKNGQFRPKTDDLGRKTDDLGRKTVDLGHERMIQAEKWMIQAEKRTNLNKKRTNLNKKQMILAEQRTIQTEKADDPERETIYQSELFNNQNNKHLIFHWVLKSKKNAKSLPAIVIVFLSISINYKNTSYIGQSPKLMGHWQSLTN